MRSGWFFGTEMWTEYLQAYAKTRPDCLKEWRSSPLANDHRFALVYGMTASDHQSRVIDLRLHNWSDVRKSYHAIIHRADDHYDYIEAGDIFTFREIHRNAFGDVRPDETFFIQQKWLQSGRAMAYCACDAVTDQWVAAALWIIYNGCAYYASGPSMIPNVQHAVIWHSLQLLKQRGITLVDMGQIDGETEKERNIGLFKSGFGGVNQPFTIVRRLA